MEASDLQIGFFITNSIFLENIILHSLVFRCIGKLDDKELFLVKGSTAISEK